MRLMIAHGIFSLDHPVRSRQHVGRNCEADLLRSLEIDNKVEFGGPFDWKIYWFRAFEDFVHEQRRTLTYIEDVRSIRDQTTRFGEM